MTQNTDPHLLAKIANTHTAEDLDALREAIRDRGETLPDGAAARAGGAAVGTT